MRIDFHSHILPQMDDGSKSDDMSAKMLRIEKTSGIAVTCLTPHYYKTVETPKSFLERRNLSFEKLLPKYDNNVMPLTVFGAEIEMYERMSEDELSGLCIGNTNMLLCEMPSRYEYYVYDELTELICQGFVPLVAHFERYFDDYGKQNIAKLASIDGCIFQVNISSLQNKRIRKKIFELADNGIDFVLGTDAHNLTSRPPYIDLSCLEPSKKTESFSASVALSENSLMGVFQQFQ